MYESQPCHICKAKSFGVIRELAGGLPPRHYCKRHYWPEYKRVMADVDKPSEPEKPKQISLL